MAFTSCNLGFTLVIFAYETECLNEISSGRRISWLVGGVGSVQFFRLSLVLQPHNAKHDR